MSLTEADQKLIDECYTHILGVALEAGELVKEGFSAVKDVQLKGTDGDIVTDYDTRVEELIIGSIRAKFPDHQFIAEESAYSAVKQPELGDGPTWIIDPIDGTCNFVHQIPLICISIAFVVKKQIVIGIVYNPILNEMFTSRKGKGSFLNGIQIHTSKVEILDLAVYAHEVTFIRVAGIRTKNARRVHALACCAQGFRALGSAALTLAYVARGSIDAYQVDDLQPWDTAAGALLIWEAGGSVYNSNGEPFDIMKCNIAVASTEKLCQEVLAVIKKADQNVLTV